MVFTMTDKNYVFTLITAVLQLFCWLVKIKMGNFRAVIYSAKIFISHIEEKLENLDATENCVA